MIRFQLVASTGTKFDDEAYEILVPTKAGTVGIFEDHMPMISAAQPGVLSIRRKAGDPDSALEHFAVNGGVLATKGPEARFMADDVTTSEEVNEAEAQAALKRAEQAVEGAADQMALEEAHRLLHHSTAKLRIATLKRRHHR